jgi:AraC family transcriptional regulator
MELQLPVGRARIVRFISSQPLVDISGCPSEYRVNLALTPTASNGGVCFSEKWAANEFKPIGSLYVLPPGQTVRARGDCDPHASLVCEFAPAAIDAWFDGDVRWTSRRLEAMLDISNPNMRAPLRRLSEEMRNPGLASDAICELLAAQVAIESARHCHAVDEVKGRSGLPTWKLRLIDERLAEIGAAPTLSELAALCNVSVRQLTRGFRISRGRSIGEHIAQNRLAHATRLLAGDQSIKAIAYALGFPSPSGFCAAFRRDTGVTPSEFRTSIASSK